jgi:hypothetical protein
VSENLTSGNTYTFKLPLMTGDTGNCMDVTAASTSSGANIEEYDCNGTGAQSFVTNEIRTSGGTGCGYYQLKNTHSGLCVDVQGGVPFTRGTNIDQWGCKSWSSSTCPTASNSIANQAFSFVASNGYYKIQSLYYDATYPSYCIDVHGGASATANGTNIQIYNCNGGYGQTFNPYATTSGTVASGCNYASWSSSTTYSPGDVVEYTVNGYYHYYTANQTNTNVDPTCAVYAHSSAGPCGWYTYSDCCNPCTYGATSSCGSDSVWSTHTCGSGTNGGTSTSGIAGALTSSQFSAFFPNVVSFYTYTGLTETSSSYAAFCNETDTTIRKREVAAFLANMSIESGDLTCVDEIDESGNYCDTSRSYGCPAPKYTGTKTCPGQTATPNPPPSAYYGRGPLQISWNFNYYLAGQSIGQDLLNYPGNVSGESPTNISASEAQATTWKTAVWYWMTQLGPGGYGNSAHDAMTNSGGSGGFGETIKHINGAVECPSLGGSNTASRDARIAKYKSFCDQLGVTYGNNLSC